jgi:hypothetical protein
MIALAPSHEEHTYSAVEGSARRTLTVTATAHHTQPGYDYTAKPSSTSSLISSHATPTSVPARMSEFLQARADHRISTLPNAGSLEACAGHQRIFKFVQTRTDQCMSSLLANTGPLQARAGHQRISKFLQARTDHRMSTLPNAVPLQARAGHQRKSKFVQAHAAEKTASSLVAHVTEQAHAGHQRISKFLQARAAQDTAYPPMAHAAEPSRTGHQRMSKFVQARATDQQMSISPVATRVQARHDAEKTAYLFVAHAAAESTATSTRAPLIDKKFSGLEIKQIGIIAGCIVGVGLFLAMIYGAVYLSQRINERKFDIEQGIKRQNDCMDFVNTVIPPDESAKKFRGSKPVALVGCTIN